MVSVDSVVSGWFLLPVLCVGYGFCCQCCVLVMVSVDSVVCSRTVSSLFTCCLLTCSELA